jgi:hypothetical protein
MKFVGKCGDKGNAGTDGTFPVFRPSQICPVSRKLGNVPSVPKFPGDQIPEDLKGGNGPAGLKSKAEIIQFLKDSFALGHKAAATLTTENMLQTAEHSKSPRLHLATFAVAHAFDHYGQMVEYLRMNGIVPPASRGN